MRIRLRKALTAAGLVAVMILGGVALSLAHEDISAEPTHVFLIGHGASHGFSHSGGAGMRPRLECETCDAPTVAAYTVQPSRPLGLPHSAGCDTFAESSICAPKVSLYMLDSVLLI